MPSTLNCPGCGAPCGPDATTCPYCGSRLATIACPSCLGSMFVGAQFCPHCGAKAVDATSTGGQTLPCPGCGGDMAAVRVGATPMHQCAQCGSAWLEPDVFASLCADQNARGAVAAAVGGTAAKTPLPNGQRVRYVHCPVCRKVMNRVNFGHTSGIVVDVCKTHGVWFEKDELRGVLDFVAHGGMQQMQANEAAQRAQHQQALGLVDPALLAGNTLGGLATGLTLSMQLSPESGDRSPLRALLSALFS